VKLYLTDPTSHRTGVEIANLGDIIIKEAILDNLGSSVRDVSWVPLDLRKTRDAGLPPNAYLVLAGANVLANRFFLNASVWRPPFADLTKTNFLVLFGVGWWQYQRGPDIFTRLLYRRFAAKHGIQHSVRDSYTKSLLLNCGIKNVLNTGCPSMWKLPDQLVFDPVKADSVVFTVTDYNRDVQRDAELVRLLAAEYEKLYFFPQGTADETYLNSIAGSKERDRISVLERSVDAFNTLLRSPNIDYVGTRLHGGIRALQHGKRAIVISIDNRAREISRDTGLPVVSRDNLVLLPKLINEQFEISLKLPRREIADFKESWASLVNNK
jgi:hypothetical protein